MWLVARLVLQRLKLTFYPAYVIKYSLWHFYNWICRCDPFCCGSLVLEVMPDQMLHWCYAPRSVVWLRRIIKTSHIAVCDVFITLRSSHAAQTVFRAAKHQWNLWVALFARPNFSSKMNHIPIIYIQIQIGIEWAIYHILGTFFWARSAKILYVLNCTFFSDFIPLQLWNFFSRETVTRKGITNNPMPITLWHSKDHFTNEWACNCIFSLTFRWHFVFLNLNSFDASS